MHKQFMAGAPQLGARWSRFLKKYRERESIERKKGSGRLSVVTDDVKCVVEEEMVASDETTAVQLQKFCERRGMSCLSVQC